MRLWKMPLGALLAGAVLTFGAAAEAQSPQAKQLYDDGLKAMLDGDFAQGCPTLQKSVDLARLPGALFTLAACYERWGKVYTAKKRYEEFIQLQSEQDLSSLPQDKRERAEKRLKNAMTQVQTLASKVPALTVKVEPAAPGTTVTIDDVPASADTPIDLDPGEHTVVAQPPNGEPVQRIVTLAEGQRADVTLTVVTSAPPDSTVEPPDDDGGGGNPRDAMLIGSIAAGGVGVAALIAGSVTGGLVFSKKGTVEDGCVERVCTPEAKEAVDEAQTLGLVSTVSFVVAGVGVGAAALLFFLAPEEDAEADALARSGLSLTPLLGAGPNGGMLGLKGTF